MTTNAGVRSRVMIIGSMCKDDRFTLGFAAARLSMAGRSALSELLRDAIIAGADEYDMQTHPERGDAMDHLGPDLGLVVALHLCGIGTMPGGRLHERISSILGEKIGVKAYCRDNFYLLLRCMELGVPLLAWGDQPWFGAQRVLDLTLPHTPARLILYEPDDEADEARAERVMEKYFDTDIVDADSAMDVFLDNGVRRDIASRIVREMFPEVEEGT